MKKQLSKQKTAQFRSYEIAALLLFAVLIIPSFVSAQPSSNPPGGNVDASFNTVTVGPGSFDYFIQPGGGANTEITSRGNLIFDMNNGLGTLFFQNNAGSTTLSLNSAGVWDIQKPFTVADNIDIQNGILDSTGAVQVLDDDGFQVATGAGTVGFQVSSGGEISNPTGNVTVNDTLDVRNGIRDDGAFQILELNDPDGVNVSGILSVFDDTWISGMLSVINQRVEFTGTTDASGSPNTGVLEIGNALRLDSNEIITNTGSPLYLNHDNGGDLYVDAGTLFVDASANRVGIRDTSPSYDLDVNGNLNVTNGSSYVRAYGSGSLYNSGIISSSSSIYSGGNMTAYSGYMRAGSIGRFYTNDSGAYNPRNDFNTCHYSATWGSTPNDYCSMYASCSSGDVIMGMMTGYTAGMGAAGGWQYVASGFSDIDTGYIVFYSPDDNNSAPTTVYARAVCFSPNG